MKTSIPKLHSVRWKNGALAPNVSVLKTYNSVPIPAINCLRGAYEEDLKEIIILGYNDSGEEKIFTNQTTVEKAAYMFSRGQIAMIRETDL